jgi:hypothetical protein
MLFQDMLSALGVLPDTLASAEREQLDRDGYTLLPGVIGAQHLADLRACCDDIIAREGVPSDADGGSCHRIHHLIDRSPLFDIVWSHPRILAAIWHVVQDEFRPSALNYRSPLPGGGLQHLHSDDTWTDDGRFAYAQAIIPLVDLSPENGGPRFVPGTHRLRGRGPGDEMADVRATHPREVRPMATAGSALVFNGTLWHSGTANMSTAPRPVLHIGFFLRHPNNPRMGGTNEIIRPETYARLSPVHRHFLDASVLSADTVAYAYQAEVLKPFQALRLPAPESIPA